MRTLVIGDIHGGLRALHQIYERAKVTPQDSNFLEICRWLEPIPQVIDYLIQLKTTNNCILFVATTMNYYCIGSKTLKTIRCGINMGRSNGFSI
jgi:hypothetical protein